MSRLSWIQKLSTHNHCHSSVSFLMSSLKLRPFAVHQLSLTAAAGWTNECTWAELEKRQHNSPEQRGVTVLLWCEIKVYLEASLSAAWHQISADLWHLQESLCWCTIVNILGRKQWYGGIIEQYHTNMVHHLVLFSFAMSRFTCHCWKSHIPLLHNYLLHTVSSWDRLRWSIIRVTSHGWISTVY